MVDELIKSIMKQMKEDYPQLECPGAMKALVVSVRKTGDMYKTRLFLKDVQTGDRKEYQLEQECYIYSVRIIDNAGNELKDYPVLPEIKSRHVYKAGDIVTVVFTGGEMNPVIVGD